MARIKIKEDEFSIRQVAQKVRGEETAKPTKTPKASKIALQRASIPGPRSPRSLIIGLVAIVMILLAGFYVYGLRLERDDLRQEVNNLKKDPAIITRQETQRLLARVGSIIELPTDEAPTIADVTDVEAARKQDAFYTEAQNGDKVLFYTQAGKAILYRPGTNKVITVTNINTPKP